MTRLAFLPIVAMLLVPVAPLGGQAPDQLASIDSLIDGGRYTEAEQAARAALARAEAGEGPQSAAAAHVLNRLSDALLRQGRSDAETEAFVRRALEIEENIEPATRGLASAIRNLGWLLEARGEFEPSKTAYARALDVLRAALGPDNRETLLMQKDLAMAWVNLGEYAKARELLESALAKRLEQDPHHMDVAVLRHNLGAVYWELGEYAAARDAFTDAAAGLARALGDDHPHVATALEGLAVVQVAFGEYAEARSTYRRALAIREKALPPGHPMIGQSYVNMGDVLMSMGDYAGARQALEHGLSIWEKSLGPDHPQLLIALTNLAALRQRTGDRAGARQALERGISIREKAGKDDPDLVIPLTQLANLLADSRHLDAARTYYERARDLGIRTRGPDHPYVATAELEEGLRLAARGRLGEAAPLIERARAAREKVLGREHPDVAAALDASARLAALKGDTSGALDEALDAEALAREHYQSAAALLPESQALQYAEGRARSQDLAIALAVKRRVDDAVVERIWDAVVRSRALVLEEMSWRRRVVRSASQAGVRDAVDEASTARARLAQLFLRGPSQHAADYARELAAAREAKDRAEERLAAESTAYRRDRSRRTAGLDAVRDALPDGAALVSFVRYEDRVISADLRPHHYAYAAFVLPSRSSRPALVPLGPAASLEALIGRWRRQVRAETTAPPMGAAQRERTYRGIAASLRGRIWDPIASRVGDASRVMIVPDAALHLVDFAVLPTGSRAYLVETGPVLHYATAERDLIPDSATPGNGLLAVGAPAFDRAPVVRAAISATRLRSDCLAAPGARFASLPESGREADAVARLWRINAGAGAVVLRGAEASESALKAGAPGRRVLHLATHGFVMGEGCTPSYATGATGAAATLEANPLLGAGLVLAGASRRSARSDRREDGILTAEEISALDLAGVEWAVLSACDSGAGLVRAGEGVFGLRRAFQIAGVRTVIMSLWPIDDRVARSWMTSLYSARLERHRTTADAVREASLSALARRRRGGESTHPLYWSGFVAAGDWR